MRIGTFRWLEFMRRRREQRELERELLRELERERERHRHHHHHHHPHNQDFSVKLEFDCMSAALTIVVGDNGHAALLTVTNPDGTPAQNVNITYASDTPAVCDVDPASGALTPASEGTANITGTGTRGTFTHGDTGVVTVTQNDQGDFAVSLSLQ